VRPVTDLIIPRFYRLCCFRTLTFAAVDTTSGALARILSTLAEHSNVQDKLRKELTEAHESNADFNYDDLSSLPYLDAVCRETLRL
jgi:cytochrome P450